MKFFSLAVLSTLLRQAWSIECWRIGYGSVVDNSNNPNFNPEDSGTWAAEGGETIQMLDPFTPGQGFDIIDINTASMYMRFHHPNGQNSYNAFWESMQLYEEGKIKTAHWEQTPDQVRDTMINHGGSDSNVPLWLATRGESSATTFAYAGLLTRYPGMTPLSGLNTPLGVVSIILPSGTSKLQAINPSTPHEGIENAIRTGIFGISSTDPSNPGMDLDPAVDYAYTSVYNIARGLLKRFPANVDPKTDLDNFEGLIVGPGFDNWNRRGPYFKASRQDGSCVVVDLRSMPKWLEWVRNDYQWVEQCSWDVKRRGLKWSG